jgi:hypothetical protein
MKQITAWAVHDKEEIDVYPLFTGYNFLAIFQEKEHAERYAREFNQKVRPVLITFPEKSKTKSLKEHD